MAAAAAPQASLMEIVWTYERSVFPSLANQSRAGRSGVTVLIGSPGRDWLRILIAGHAWQKLSCQEVWRIVAELWHCRRESHCNQFAGVLSVMASGGRGSCMFSDQVRPGPEPEWEVVTGRGGVPDCSLGAGTTAMSPRDRGGSSGGEPEIVTPLGARPAHPGPKQLWHNNPLECYVINLLPITNR